MGGLNEATQPIDMLAVLDEDPSYARALGDRLNRIRAELEGQGSNAVSLRQKVMTTRRESEINTHELAKLRAVWAADQPRRDAFVSETGEAERRLAERERRCAEAWAAQAAARYASAPTTPASRGGIGSETALRGTEVREEKEQKQRIASMDSNRLKLQRAVDELCEVAKQDRKAIQQLRGRIESLKGESDSLKSASDAARTSFCSFTGRIEALDATMAAGQQKQMSLERQVAGLQQEVSTLRNQLKDKSSEMAEMASEVSAAISSNSRPHSARSKPRLSMQQAREESSALDDEAIWATNKRLQAKVLSLREELRKKQDAIAASF